MNINIVPHGILLTRENVDHFQNTNVVSNYKREMTWDSEERRTCSLQGSF